MSEIPTIRPRSTSERKRCWMGILRFFGDRIFGPSRQRQGLMGKVREKIGSSLMSRDRAA